MTAEIIGKGYNRVEGPAKVTGQARYAADNSFEGLVHVVGVFSRVAAGRIQSITTTKAEKSPGVLLVLHHGNAPKLYRSPNDMEQGNRVGEVRPPFEDDKIYYAGQFVAAVVAETFEQAKAAADFVDVTYASETPVLSLEEGRKKNGEKMEKDTPDYRRGNPDTAYTDAGVKVDSTYAMPVEVHNPMELHATVAVWENRHLHAYESTQWVVGQRNALAKVLGLEPEDVTVYAPYIGGGFGGKLFLWPHTVVAAVAARQLGRPVKLVVDRRRMFTTVGHRPENRQRLRLGASRDGKLLSMQHDTLAHTSEVHEFLEECGSNTQNAYECANVGVTHRMVEVNVGTPTSMRAPGAASGLFALECAMDEMAEKLGTDPVVFRLNNLPSKDQSEDRPWSSNYLRECIEQVRDRFGWQHRNPKPGSMREGEEFVGWGFATATWPAHRKKANARVELRGDGTARVTSATQDIGTGTYTVMAQVAAEITGLPLEKIEVSIGQSKFPEGPISGGSMVTASIVPAVAEAARKAIEALLKVASKHGPFKGKEPGALKFDGGSVVSKESGQRASLIEILDAAKLASADGEAAVKPGDEQKHFTFKSFGAHAVEVRWDPGIARLRVTRVVTTIDCGQVVNEKTAKNQIYGSIIMGLGAALFEESIYDSRDGHVVNDNLADYLVPVNSDTPEMEVDFINLPDPKIGEFGAKGAGEIGITGVIGAVVNAIYHATGRRVRELPVRVEKLLG